MTTRSCVSFAADPDPLGSHKTYYQNRHKPSASMIIRLYKPSREGRTSQENVAAERVRFSAKRITHSLFGSLSSKQRANQDPKPPRGAQWHRQAAGGLKDGVIPWRPAPKVADFQLSPKSLSQQDAREYLGCSEDKFLDWKRAGLIKPLEGNLFLISELDALLDQLVKRRDVKANGYIPPEEEVMGSPQKIRRGRRGSIAQILLGDDGGRSRAAS